MPTKWLSYLTLGVLLIASATIGCRAPYPTYNPYGMYGNPCVTPPGTGTYNPATGRTDPYYGAPANGVYPPNPYVNPGAPAAGYPGYPAYPPAQPPAGSTSQSNWAPQANAKSVQPASHSVVDAGQAELDQPGNTARIMAAADAETTQSGQWQSVSMADSTESSVPADSRIALFASKQFDGFERN